MEKETLKEMAARCMPGVAYEHLDGKPYQQWFSPDLPHVQYERVKSLEFRHNDVMSTGMPRSGNHWTYFLLDMILKQSPVLATKSLVESFPEFWTDAERAAWDATPGPRLICSHAKLDRFPSIAKKKPRVVYIIRNPKDAMVSCYKLVHSFSEEHRFSGTWDEFFEVYLGGEFTNGSWMDHVLIFEEYMKNNPDVPVYIHSFEEMKKKPVECVKKLCAFLGVSDHLAPDIVKAAQIEHLKSAVVGDQSEVLTEVLGSARSNLIQGGEIGKWRNVFTVGQNERFDSVFQEKMKNSKLAQFVREYI